MNTFGQSSLPITTHLLGERISLAGWSMAMGLSLGLWWLILHLAL